MKFNSEYAKDANDLLRLKTEAYTPVSDKRKRMGIVRRFSNMMNMLTPEEAEERGITEITNHGLFYKSLAQNQAMYEGMVTGTNASCEIIVDTDNPEVDFTLSQRFSYAVNRYAIHHKGKVARLWAKIGGEWVISGGVPITQNEKYGWLPSPQIDMFFPPQTSLEPDEVTYAFAPKELGVKDVEELRRSIKGDEGVYLDRVVLDDLLKEIRKRVKEQTSNIGEPYSEEQTKGTRDEAYRKITIPAWNFYEIKYTEEGNQYVSSTLFADISGCVSKKSKLGNAVIIGYWDKAFDHAEDWLQLPFVDSEIGGVKNMDTVKGVAEMQFNSAQDMEELLNEIIEGEKIRARPMFKVGDQADVNELAKWEQTRSLYAPKGVEEMVMRGSSNGLQRPLAILSNNAAGITSSGPSGNSGNLRVEALENQRNNSAFVNIKLSDAFNHLDSLYENIVWRLCNAPVKAGTEGYNEIMCVRNYLKKYDIDFKKLTKRKHGQFEFIRVRARRTINNGDIEQTNAAVDWMTEQLPNVPPASRPLVMKMAWTMKTQDPDMADRIWEVPKAVINAQKITAENEADTIRRRAPLGQTLPIMPDDVHEEHIPIHMLDMQALIAKNDARPWDRLDMLEFAGLVEHTGMHISTLLEAPATNATAKSFMQDFQKIAQMGQRIASEVAEAEGQQGLEMTAKEQLDAQFKTAQLQLQARQVGLKERQQDSIEEERDRKGNLAARSQYTKEITEDERLKLEKEKLNATATNSN